MFSIPNWAINSAVTIFAAGITVYATVWGVLRAIKADNDREVGNRVAYKNRLVGLMITELDALGRFCAENQGSPRIYSDTAVETTAILETVSDQIKLFNDPELLNRLYGLRITIQKFNFAVDYLKAKPFDVKDDPVASLIKGNFSSNMRELIDYHFKKDMRNMLIAELSPEEAEKYREKSK